MNLRMLPDEEQWQFTDRLGDRKLLLERAMVFEEIVASISNSASVEAGCCEPVKNGWPNYSHFRRIKFLIRVDATAFDHFYNGRDGLRAQYWQAPEIGCAANRQTISRLESILLGYSTEYPNSLCESAFPCTMNLEDVSRSLKRASAKIWPAEEKSIPPLSEQLISRQECAEIDP